MTTQINMRLTRESRDTLERTARKLQQVRAQRMEGLGLASQKATYVETVMCALQELEAKLNRALNEYAGVR